MAHLNLVDAFSSLRFRRNEWQFVDFRINIPPASFGSDAINPHTQYSNPLALWHTTSTGSANTMAVGASFTLGEGNQMVCEAADIMVTQLDGLSVGDLIASSRGFYETLANPLQLRWLSPNAGVQLMAAGLIVNTLLDAASKACGLPAWEYLARLPSDFLLSLLQLRHLPSGHDATAFKALLDAGLDGIDARCQQLRTSGLPVYYTTWIGHDAKSIAGQITQQYQQRGIRQFKIKIGQDIENDIAKIREIASRVPTDVVLCVDANQTLSLAQAERWMSHLSDQGVLWLEEPFAPDNTRLFADLVQAKRNHGWRCEIVTGENCPNHYTATALMQAGIDRFQSDPCRMMGLLDTVLTSCSARIEGCTVTPHAGGSSLDEQSTHIQLFNLARIATTLDPHTSLTENVGFCSRYFAEPTVVSGGMAHTPTTPGLMVGLEHNITASLKDYREGISWLEL